MIEMVKKSLKIEGVEAAPGEMAYGWIPVLEGPDQQRVDLPLMVLNGSGEGPTLMLIAGEHGTELPGIRAIGKLMHKLDPEKVRGQVIAVPLCNPYSLRYSSYLSYQDDTVITEVKSSVDGVWGRPDGRETERLAYAYSKICMGHADYLINFHANPQLGENAFPFTGGIDDSPNYARDEETLAKAYRMARAFGITVMMHNLLEKPLPPPREFGGFTMQAGIPTLGLELTDARRLYPRGVEVAVKGTKNVMKMLGMLDGELERQTGVKILDKPLIRTGRILPKRGGLVEILVDNFVYTKEGESIARIWSVLGELLEEIKMPHNGYINGWICQFHGHATVVSTGDNLCYTCKNYEDPLPGSR